jgi:hypothetical protein
VENHQPESVCPYCRRPVGLKVGFSLDQFSENLNVRDAAGKPYILIGGLCEKLTVAKKLRALRHIDRKRCNILGTVKQRRNSRMPTPMPLPKVQACRRFNSHERERT